MTATAAALRSSARVRGIELAGPLRDNVERVVDLSNVLPAQAAAQISERVRQAGQVDVRERGGRLARDVAYQLFAAIGAAANGPLADQLADVGLAVAELNAPPSPAHVLELGRRAEGAWASWLGSVHGIADSEEDPTSRKGRALDLINRSMAIVFVLVSRSDSETAAEAAAVIDLVDAYRSNASIEKEVKVGLSAASWMSLDVQRVYAALTDHEHPDSDVSAGINVQRAIDLIRPIATASARREMDDPASSARAKQLAGNLVTSLATTARISDDVVRLAHSLAIELPSSRASVHEQVTSAIVYGLVALLANSETIAAAASVDGIQETTSPPDADQQLAEPQFEYAPDVVFTTAGRTDDQSDVSTDQSTVSLIQAAEIEIRPIPTPDQVLDTLVAENESLWGRARLLYDSGELSEVAQIDFLSVYESYTRQLDRVEPNLRVLNETVLEVSKWVAEADSSTTQLEIELLANAERLMTTGDDGATGIGKEMAQRVADAVAAELVDPTGGQLRQVESDVLEALGWRDHAADRLEGIEALGYRDSGAVGGFLGGALAFGVTRDPTMIPGGASLGAGKFVVLRAMFGLLRSYFRRRT